jgi:hypothetical protein
MYVPPTRYVRVPDYYMTDEMSKYNGKNKKDGCVCLGEMRYGKDIAGLARVASKTDIKLTIIGAFQSKELYLKARKYQSDKITIIDRNLTYEEYLEYLSSYKYVVLPYDAKYYDGRTSGVLLEGIFVGAIPIAPKKLLEQNKIQGLGYQKISDIPDLIKCYEQGKITVHNNLDKYSYEYVSKKLLHFLKGIN